MQISRESSDITQIQSVTNCNSSTGTTDQGLAVVVGAGIAGVLAARVLINKGFRVRILEAQDREGGRILTSNGEDLGAQWIRESGPTYKLAIELGLSSKLTRLTTELPSVGRKALLAALQTFENNFNCMRHGHHSSSAVNSGFFNQLFSSETDCGCSTTSTTTTTTDCGFDETSTSSIFNETIFQALESRILPRITNETLRNEARVWALAWFRDVLGLDITKASALWYLRNALLSRHNEHRLWVINGGFETLFDVLLSSVSSLVELNTRVLKICPSSSSVQLNIAKGTGINTTTETITAQECIITVSVGVLRDGLIAGIPTRPWPHMAHQEKAVLYFENAFWSGLSGFCDGEQSSDSDDNETTSIVKSTSLTSTSTKSSSIASRHLLLLRFSNSGCLSSVFNDFGGLITLVNLHALIGRPALMWTGGGAVGNFIRNRTGQEIVELIVRILRATRWPQAPFPVSIKTTYWKDSVFESGSTAEIRPEDQTLHHSPSVRLKFIGDLPTCATSRSGEHGVDASVKSAQHVLN